MGMSALGAAL